MSDNRWFVLVESNTTGSGRLFCRTARRLGLRPVLLARDPARYPYVAEDEVDHRVVDTASAGEVLAACRALDGPVAGVTSSSEYFIATAADTAAALDLPHPDADAIRTCRDKYRQRLRLQRAGVPTPGFAAAPTPADAADAAALLGPPVVVKPVAGSGSIATRLCADVEQARAAAAAVLDRDPAELSLPPQHAVLVEEYLDGPEYSVETMDDQVVGITAKHLGPAPHFVETGHDFPAPLDPPEADAIGAAAVQALRALGLGWGPAHVELRLTTAGPRIVEVNPRLAGGMIPRMVEEALGVDLIEQAVRIAAGLAAPVRPTRSRSASIRFLIAPRSGWLESLAGTDDALAVPGVVEVAITPGVVPGKQVVLRNAFTDRLAAVIAADADGSVAASAADKGVQALSAAVTDTAKET